MDVAAPTATTTTQPLLGVLVQNKLGQKKVNVVSRSLVYMYLSFALLRTALFTDSESGVLR